jgi:hypothetical protein
MRDGTNLSLAERLQYALALVPAGAWQERIGRSPKQLRRYLDGADPPFSVLTMLSTASGVPVAWLAAGCPDVLFGVPEAETKSAAARKPAEKAGSSGAGGPIHAQDTNFGVRPPNSEAGQPRGLFHQVDADRLARAYEAALNGIVSTAGKRPDPRRTMQVTVLLYDELTEAEEPPLKGPEPPVEGA